MSVYQFENEMDQKLFETLFDNPELVLLLKNRYQTDRVWKFCIERDPSIFGKMDNPTVEIAEYALDVDGENIIPLVTKFEYIPVTKKMAFTALRSYPGAVLYIPEDILTEEMLNMAFNAQPSLISAFSNLTYEYLIRRIQERPSDIRFVQNPRDELIYMALERDPNLCVYFTSLTPQMINLLYDLKPEYAAMYINTLESENQDYAENSETEGESTSNQWSNPY